MRLFVELSNFKSKNFIVRAGKINAQPFYHYGNLVPGSLNKTHPSESRKVFSQDRL